MTARGSLANPAIVRFLLAPGTWDLWKGRRGWGMPSVLGIMAVSPPAKGGGIDWSGGVEGGSKVDDKNNESERKEDEKTDLGKKKLIWVVLIK
uniref:Uncharacterized protein n=1 Tax=Oryza glaberrima TaxID=4538 RepID=I1QNY2_ORYGL